MGTAGNNYSLACKALVGSLNEFIPRFVLDAGDFMMGSLYHTIAKNYAFELQIMKKMGYSAITLGNHEFDFYPQGLEKVLTTGIKKGGIPQIISSNLVFSKKSDLDV